MRFLMVVLIGLFISRSGFSETLINGAGATFPFPIYTKWFSEFEKKQKDVKINYQSIGSGGGIRQLLEKTVDFGASDAPMTDEQLAKAQPSVFHIPTVLGAVVLTYNLPVAGTLKFTPELIAKIFMGEITKWDDPMIVKANPGIKLPEKKSILVTYRSDGSGTTAVFTDYLSKVSADWKTKVGQGPSVKWPTGLGGKGNEGVTGSVKNTEGAIGYVELVYAESNKLPVAEIKNEAGQFVKPGIESVTEAAAGLKTIPDDFRMSITNAAGKKAYPISAFTYLLVYSTMPKDKGTKFTQFLKWALNDGQKLAPGLGYSPLPSAVQKKALQKVGLVKFE